MKSKNLLKFGPAIAISLALGLGLKWWQRSHSIDRALHQSSYEAEWLENNSFEKIDKNNVVPFGYTLGAWPTHFQGEPIVMKMAYRKGPPQQFIQNLVQLWKPVEVEVTLEGPKTIEKNWTLLEWRRCFTEAGFSCAKEKSEFLNYALNRASPAHLNDSTALKIKWFDSLDPLGARGLHFTAEYTTYFIDRFTIITERGTAQNFSIQYVKNQVGVEARDLFIQTMGGLKIKDDLLTSREWIENKIQSVKLDRVRSISDPKQRLTELIRVQNWIFSLLSVNPTQIEPFFHLAGVTHILTRELFLAKDHTFENQEAWTLNSKSLLETIIAYAKDFGSSGKTVIHEIEALLEDVLFMQQKISSGKSL